MLKEVSVIGAGLAGSEAAWQIANAGIHVKLYEMRPNKSTKAHQTEKFAELVCSNSLRSNSLTNAVGLLKEEMRRLNSLVITTADQTALPAGAALAVDRERFAKVITEKLKNHPNIRVIHKEVSKIPKDSIVVVASGPLTSKALAQAIKEFNDSEDFYFYDAAAPIVEKATIDMDKVYLKSRYDKGDAAYLNCPMSKKEFTIFYEALIHAKVAPLKTFEKEKFFEGCMPIEVMAKRGIKTMLFGPLKPVGLEDPKTGKCPYAVVQLRQDDAAASLYNIVGFQTHLKWSEQKRVFRLIPGLEKGEFARLGVMHRNTFINSPKLLDSTYESHKQKGLFFAGQMTGVEGYVESASSGLVAGLNAARLACKLPLISFPETTAIGAMAHYITHTSGKYFQPMNVNFGIIKELPEKIRDKRLRYKAIAERALNDLEKIVKNL
jgi:methylenetetrahydrofolate--tRNA-(uracil-5-)-methyltransferase